MAATFDRHDDYPLAQTLKDRDQAAITSITRNDDKNLRSGDHSNGLRDDPVINVPSAAELDGIAHSSEFPDDVSGQSIVDGDDPVDGIALRAAETQDRSPVGSGIWAEHGIHALGSVRTVGQDNGGLYCLARGGSLDRWCRFGRICLPVGKSGCWCCVGWARSHVTLLTAHSSERRPGESAKLVWPLSFHCQSGRISYQLKNTRI